MKHDWRQLTAKDLARVTEVLVRGDTGKRTVHLENPYGQGPVECFALDDDLDEAVQRFERYRGIRHWTLATEQDLRSAHSIRLHDPATGKSRPIGSDRMAPFSNPHGAEEAHTLTGSKLTFSCDQDDFDETEASIRAVRRSKAS